MVYAQPESILENEMHEILWNFQMLTPKYVITKYWSEHLTLW